MKLEDKVLSLEWSRKLLNAGIKLETERAWVLFKGPFPPMIKSYGDLRRDDGHIIAVIPAPDMHELWEALPKKIGEQSFQMSATGLGYYDPETEDSMIWFGPFDSILEGMAIVLCSINANHPEAMGTR